MSNNHLSRDRWLDMLRDIRVIGGSLPDGCFTEFHLGIMPDGAMLMSLEITDGNTGQQIFIPKSGPTTNLPAFAKEVYDYLQVLKG